MKISRQQYMFLDLHNMDTNSILQQQYLILEICLHVVLSFSFGSFMPYLAFRTLLVYFRDWDWVKICYEKIEDRNPYCCTLIILRPISNIWRHILPRKCGHKSPHRRHSSLVWQTKYNSFTCIHSLICFQFVSFEIRKGTWD